MQRFACPTPDFRGRYRCIDDRALCNGFFDCPGREDEKPDQCLFFKTVSRSPNKSLASRWIAGWLWATATPDLSNPNLNLKG